MGRHDDRVAPRALSRLDDHRAGVPLRHDQLDVFDTGLLQLELDPPLVVGCGPSLCFHRRSDVLFGEESIASR